MNGKIYKYFNKKKYEKEGIAKYYIGQTIRTIEQRAGKNGEKYTKDHNTKFANAINKWGWDAFECEILVDGIQTQGELNKLEINYIIEYDSFNNGYNTTPGGDNADLTSFITKKVYCPEMDMIFNSIKDAADFIDLKCPNNISEVCKNKRTYAGKAIVDGTIMKLTWKFIDNNTIITTKKVVEKIHQTSKRKIFCPELNMIFESTEDAIAYIGISTKGNISKVCRGQRQYAGSYTIDGIKTKLTWKYID